MKMCEAILLFILLFTGYLCNTTDIAANTTTSSHIFSSTSEVTQAPESETPPHDNNDVPVAGISISFVFLFILVIIGVWYARKKSKGRSASRN
ncbi:uncharacterized protein ACIBXB_012409 isoform 2-T2 [Morphnus guianensis]